MKRNIVVAMTGASGTAYAIRLLEVLLAAGCDVHLALSAAAQTVLRQEMNLWVDLERFEPAMLWPDYNRLLQDAKLVETRRLAQNFAASAMPWAGIEEASKLHYYRPEDFHAPLASGSFLTDGMVICPCSTKTLSAVVLGATNNLIHRAADVHLKERRPLVLVPRETPLSVVHLVNMQRAVEAGAILLPAMPGFYHGPKTIEDLVDFIVSRICDQLGIANNLIQRWGSE